jgi:hypothetical protein
MHVGQLAQGPTCRRHGRQVDKTRQLQQVFAGRALSLAHYVLTVMLAQIATIANKK